MSIPRPIKTLKAGSFSLDGEASIETKGGELWLRVSPAADPYITHCMTEQLAIEIDGAPYLVNEKRWQVGFRVSRAPRPA